jgi:GNAT superfamily N-acetyltransferase
MNSPYTIRAAQPGDLDRLVELLLALQDHVEASNPDIWTMTVQARANLKGQVAARIQAANSLALVAEHSRDGVIGLIFGRVTANNRYNPSRAGSVDQAFVREDHRRVGVGSRLVEELCRYFADEGAEDLTLRYVAGNADAESFWTALGFSARIITAGTSRRTVHEHLAQSDQR